jgi:hypothetical protein
MAGEKQQRRRNPFLYGGIGVLLMLAGFVLKTHLPALLEDAEEQRVAARLQEARRAGGANNPEAAAVVDRTSSYYRHRLHWEMVGRLVFIVGLGFVAAAGLVWYQQAHQPEPEPEAEDEANPDNNGMAAAPPLSEL